MLNLFPIQFLAPLAYFVLRVVVGFIFLYLGKKHLRARSVLKDSFTLPWIPSGSYIVWVLGLTELLMGLMFIFGFLTQLAALIAIIFSTKLLILHKYFSHPLIPNKLFLGLLLAASFSLLITGAGIFAFDLPI